MRAKPKTTQFRSRLGGSPPLGRSRSQTLRTLVRRLTSATLFATILFGIPNFADTACALPAPPRPILSVDLGDDWEDPWEDLRVGAPLLPGLGALNAQVLLIEASWQTSTAPMIDLGTCHRGSNLRTSTRSR
jgi:hypothetical protein